MKSFLPKSFSLSKLSAKERRLFYVMAALLLAFIMQRFVVRNIYSEITTLSNRIARLQLNYQKAQSLIANKEEILQAAEKYEDYLKAGVGEGEDSLSQILSLLESIARQNNLVLSDIKPGQSARESPSHLSYSIDLGLQGSPQQIMRFIADLQKADVLFRVERANLIPAEGSLQLKLQLSSVVLK
ncbi:hypothetical protein ACFL1D_04450 [Candidatus Omnitrophota bacterium]